MNTLIVYYSFSFNNELLALELQNRLSCDIVKIEELGRRRRFSIFLDRIFNRLPKIKHPPIPFESYDKLVFVSPIWAGQIATPLKAFLLNNKDRIKNYSFITVCGGAENQRERIVMELTSITDHAPESVVELWIRDLLTSSKANDIKAVMNFKCEAEHLHFFDNRINDFLRNFSVIAFQ